MKIGSSTFRRRFRQILANKSSIWLSEACDDYRECRGWWTRWSLSVSRVGVPVKMRTPWLTTPAALPRTYSWNSGCMIHEPTWHTQRIWPPVSNTVRNRPGCIGSGVGRYIHRPVNPGSVVCTHACRIGASAISSHMQPDLLARNHITIPIRVVDRGLFVTRNRHFINQDKSISSRSL
jgi:hypothetical protein